MTFFDRGPYNDLRVWAEMFYDVQETRKAIGNRIGRAEVLLPDLFTGHLEDLHRTEHQWGLELVRQYRRTAPAGAVVWQKKSKGVGEHLLARLLGHLGHPRIAIPYHWEGNGDTRKLVPDEPFERSVSQLWSYCGHGDPGRRKFTGMTAEDAFRLGSPQCKMIVHLLAEACIKQPGRLVESLLDPGQARDVTHGMTAGVTVPADTATPIADSQPRPSPVWPYRQVYETRRLVTRDRCHTGPCLRCGPSGHPAPDGSKWSLKHAHADGLRIVGKELLRDLWVASGDVN